MADLRVLVIAGEHPDLVAQTTAALWCCLDEPRRMIVAATRQSGWAQCVGRDVLIVEAGHLLATPRASAILRAQTRAGHCLLSLLPAFAADGWQQAAAHEAIVSDNLTLFSAAVQFIPAAVTTRLGGWRDYGHPVLDAADYVVRAKALGWRWCYSLRVRQATLVPEQRLSPSIVETGGYQTFVANSKAYEEGELDVYVPVGGG